MGPQMASLKGTAEILPFPARYLSNPIALDETMI